VSISFIDSKLIDREFHHKLYKTCGTKLIEVRISLFGKDLEIRSRGLLSGNSVGKAKKLSKEIRTVGRVMSERKAPTTEFWYVAEIFGTEMFE
jgi:hypothetical protein